jgi:hypothetical protein
VLASGVFFFFNSTGKDRIEKCLLEKEEKNQNPQEPCMIGVKGKAFVSFMETPLRIKGQHIFRTHSQRATPSPFPEP